MSMTAIDQCKVCSLRRATLAALRTFILRIVQGAAAVNAAICGGAFFIAKSAGQDDRDDEEHDQDAGEEQDKQDDLSRIHRGY